MLNLILAYDDAGLSSADVAEARNDATPALGARLKEAHRRAAAALAGELAGLSSSEAYDRAWGWALENEHRLIAWGLHFDTAHACASGVALSALLALGSRKGAA